uniref:Uncharacterized protein n=1 Tax=viral metagenome TaxID=1070528 RepID=A0A6M3X6C5_9ZZZZ
MKLEDIMINCVGVIVVVIGLCIWIADYIIFIAIGALASSVAGLLGFTGLALLGLQVLYWMFTLGLIILIFVVGLWVVFAGLGYDLLELE